MTPAEYVLFNSQSRYFLIALTIGNYELFMFTGRTILNIRNLC